jgi:hypothetical protein
MYPREILPHTDHRLIEINCQNAALFQQSLPYSSNLRPTVKLRNLVIQLPEFNAVVVLQELLGSGRRADVVRIFELNCPNEVAVLASNISAVFRHDALLYCIVGQASKSAPSSVLLCNHRLFLQRLRSERAICLS